MDGSGGGGIPSMAFRTTSDDGDGDGDAETGSPAIHASLSSEESRRRPDNNNNNILGSYSSSFPEEIRGSLSLVMAEEEGESTGDQHAIPLGGDALRKRPASSTYPTTDRIVPLKQFDEELQPVASIDQAGTFTTGEPEHDDDSEQSNSSRSLASKQKSADKSMDDIYKEDDNDSGGSNSVPALGCACAQKQFQYWIYIGASAVIGGTLRVYLSRLFGEDCELRESSGVQDSLTALFSRICVTAGGRTLQTGGALFRDWPANMLGCFFMGILTSHLHSSPFPWFHKDHPLQGNKFLLAAHGVGLCGCMTTFASWNTQMVIMMDGTYTELGPQVVPALFGYLLGMMGCITSYRVGRVASAWMYSKVNNGVSERGSDDISQLSASVTGEKEVRVQSCVARIFRPIHLLHLAALLIICVFFLLDYTDGNLFYKKMAIMSLMSPLGALSRWKLSRWNSAKHPKIHSKHWPWLPWGTLLANLTGAILSIACQGLLDRYGHTWSDWANALLFAVKVGFAGGLSTVSTFVKEVVSIEEKYPGHAKPFIYATLTCIGGTVVGLIVYMPIVRL